MNFHAWNVRSTKGRRIHEGIFNAAWLYDGSYCADAGAGYGTATTTDEDERPAVAVRLVSCAAIAAKSAPALRRNPRQSEAISGSKGGDVEG